MQSKKVGIVTYTRSNNYGARLQAYAVYKIMKDMGFDAEIIDVDYPKRYYKYVVGRILNLSDSISEWFGKYVITYKMLRFNKRNIGATRHIITRSTDKMCEFINNQGYDAVICGSDEIWSSRTREIAPPSIYFLPEKINALKIAFSPSANGNHVFKEAEKKWLKCNLEAYSLLGVRDEMTLALVRDELRIEKAELIYDPTLYVEFPSVKLPKKLQKNAHKKKVCFAFARPYGNIAEKIMSVLGGAEYEFFSVFSKVKQTNYLTISPEQFTCIWGEFDLVYTNFFHGVIFSLKNHANVIALDTFEKYVNKTSKVRDLVSRLGVGQIFFSTVEGEFDFDGMVDFSKKLLNNECVVDANAGMIEAKKVLGKYTEKVRMLINESEF